MTSINELKHDLAEVETLLSQAKRPRIMDILKVEERRLNNKITEITKETMKKTEPTTSKAGATAKGVYQVQLRNYAWDQTNSLVKIYVTLSNVQSLPKENVYCNFSDARSFELHVKGLENKDYVLIINKLLQPIVPEKCSYRVKSDKVIVSLSKSKEGNWSHITETEKKVNDVKSQKFDDMGGDKDPASSLMSMMKNLYNSGDDEMKKTIEKSWLESNSKRGNSSLDGF